MSKVRAPAASSGGGLGASGRREPSSRGEQLAALVARELGVGPLALAEPVEELAHGVVMGVRVLAHVEGRELEAERRDRAVARSTRPRAISSPRCSQERRAHQLELGQQLARADVVAPGLVRATRRRAARRVLSSFWRMQVSLSRYGSSALRRR